MADNFVQINVDDLMVKLSSLTPNEKRYIIEVLELYLFAGALTRCPDEISDE